MRAPGRQPCWHDTVYRRGSGSGCSGRIAWALAQSPAEGGSPTRGIGREACGGSSVPVEVKMFCPAPWRQEVGLGWHWLGLLVFLAPTFRARGQWTAALFLYVRVAQKATLLHGPLECARLQCSGKILSSQWLMHVLWHLPACSCSEPRRIDTLGHANFAEPAC